MSKKLEVTAPEAVENVRVTPEPKAPTIGALIAEMVMDAELSYDMIVNLIHARFPKANTSSRSVASVAARLRKDGVDVPMRRKGKADEATA